MRNSAAQSWQAHPHSLKQESHSQYVTRLILWVPLTTQTQLPPPDLEKLYLKTKTCIKFSSLFVCVAELFTALSLNNGML